MDLINVFYQKHILAVGGVETFLRELAHLCNVNHRDLTIVYRTGDKAQINQLRHYVNVLSIKDIETLYGAKLRCKRAFFNYNITDIDMIEADEYYQLIHADFMDKSISNLNPIQSDKISNYIAVSKNNAKSFNAVTGVSPDVIYNPLIIDDVPKVLTIVSAQRWSKEKGCDRIKSMIKALDDSGIPYVWHIFTDRPTSIKSPNVMIHPPTDNIRGWMKIADYTVLLSDTEGFSYTAYESLTIGTPLIITKLPVLSELGCNNSNSIILDFDLSNLDVNTIYSKAGTFKFNYKPKGNDRWLDMLPEETNYVLPKYVTIQATAHYFDSDADTDIPIGTIYEVPEFRAKDIINLGYAKYYKEEVK